MLIQELRLGAECDYESRFSIYALTIGVRYGNLISLAGAFEVQAVGFDWDGNIKPIEELM